MQSVREKGATDKTGKEAKTKTPESSDFPTKIQSYCLITHLGNRGPESWSFFAELHKSLFIS